ncbi:membrane protein YqaA with SNARE-associated domain [Tenacibaculum adriaticum]|uniref:Membrane protein YqaA with SNARE-associated domain n=1 Tax=Tenacibaculum adriaticum TaxID=413713 RepID=A0A5S5DPP1_9FLAO|nr:short-chain dehydrogenase [Tenacibaculum adriaticum]TYP97903.1 membrane protein YqaA with SNARE-associated domain [Tenacibaculum adriaticum]
MSKKKKKKNVKPHYERLHNYYHRTGFYMFIWESLKKAFLPIVFAVIGLILFNKYVYNINDGLHKMTETFSRAGILISFFISETILGLVPPEIFIAWSKKTSEPLVNLSILATLSYLGGITAYFIGRASLKINAIREYLEVKMAKNLKNTSKWGGILILVGALLPLPFAISCMTAGMIKYPLKGVLTFGLFRFLRFAIYAWAIFSMVN